MMMMVVMMMMMMMAMMAMFRMLTLFFVAGENHAGQLACSPHSRLHATPWPITYVRTLLDDHG